MLPAKHMMQFNPCCPPRPTPPPFLLCWNCFCLSIINIVFVCCLSSERMINSKAYFLFFCKNYECWLEPFVLPYFYKNSWILWISHAATDVLGIDAFWVLSLWAATNFIVLNYSGKRRWKYGKVYVPKMYSSYRLPRKVVQLVSLFIFFWSALANPVGELLFAIREKKILEVGQKF